MFRVVLLLAGCCRAAAVSRLEAWGEHAIRVRVAAPGLADVVDPPIVALKGSAGASDAVSLTHGNLRVDVDPATSLMTATRVSDGATLLRQTALEWRAATPGARDGSRAAVATFAGVGADGACTASASTATAACSARRSRASPPTRSTTRARAART